MSKLSTAILKVTERCNLNCTYCYMFNQNDRSYVDMPGRMQSATAQKAVARIAEYCYCSNLTTFNLIFHGGEPTLWPISNFKSILKDISRWPQIDWKLSMQTNGLKLDTSLLELCRESDIAVGVSIDGPQYYNDSRRIDRHGNGSYDRIMKNVIAALEAGYGDVLIGFLSVANTQIPPDVYLKWVRSLPLKKVDVLWPIEYNYESPPWGSSDFLEYAKNPLYGAWFSDLFRLWFELDDPSCYIRIFYETIEVFLGSRSHGDFLKNTYIPAFVIDSNGQISHSDYVRGYKHGWGQSALNIFEHTISQFEATPVVQYLLNLGNYLPIECANCDHKLICGGGFVPGRMHSDLSDPRSTRRSVLCLDEDHYFGTVRNIIFPNMPTNNTNKQRIVDSWKATLQT